MYIQKNYTPKIYKNRNDVFAFQTKTTLIKYLFVLSLISQTNKILVAFLLKLPSKFITAVFGHIINILLKNKIFYLTILFYLVDYICLACYTQISRQVKRCTWNYS